MPGADSFRSTTFSSKSRPDGNQFHMSDQALDLLFVGFAYIRLNARTQNGLHLVTLPHYARRPNAYGLTCFPLHAHRYAATAPSNGEYTVRQRGNSRLETQVSSPVGGPRQARVITCSCQFPLNYNMPCCHVLAVCEGEVVCCVVPAG